MAVTITRTAWTDDDGTGTTGTVINNAAKTSLYDQIDTALAALLPLAGGTMTGDLKFTDATYDIGKSGATRPRDIFLSRNLIIGGTTSLGGNVVSDLLFTDATYDIGKSGATRPRDGFFSRNMTIGGLLTLTGGQAAFPATQVPSSDANTLDDYEEGTFTPSNGHISFGSASGYYIKIGRLVMVWFSVTWPSTADANSADIAGLPFTPDTGKRAQGAITNTDLGSAITLLGSAATAAVNVFDLSGNAKTNANLSTKSISGVLSYYAAA